MRTEEPQHPGFFELALRHRYPLRHLSTARLPYCELGSYRVQVRMVARCTSPKRSPCEHQHLHPSACLSRMNASANKCPLNYPLDRPVPFHRRPAA
jgi:hypothetical protein